MLIIEDDGIGFDIEENENRSQGLGLIGMGERAALVNGEIEIESVKGNGITIYVRVPANYEETEMVNADRGIRIANNKHDQQ